MVQDNFSSNQMQRIEYVHQNQPDGVAKRKPVRFRFSSVGEPIAASQEDAAISNVVPIRSPRCYGPYKALKGLVRPKVLFKALKGLISPLRALISPLRAL